MLLGCLLTFSLICPIMAGAEELTLHAIPDVGAGAVTFTFEVDAGPVMGQHSAIAPPAPQSAPGATGSSNGMPQHAHMGSMTKSAVLQHSAQSPPGRSVGPPQAKHCGGSSQSSSRRAGPKSGTKA